VGVRLNIENGDEVKSGDIICHRDHSLVPISDYFQADVELFELLQYKPIFSKGYKCMIHIHTLTE
jgi:translation elongation factor EF-1alpha